MLRATMTIMLVALAAAAIATAGDDGAPRASSASYTLDWYVLDANGGGSASSAGYAASVTIGQTVVGATADATRRAGLGFWFGLDVPLFVDGFESGNTSAWSATVPPLAKSAEVRSAWTEGAAADR